MRGGLIKSILAGALVLGAAAPAVAEEIVLKLWSRADRSGPLRPANIISAAETLNRMFEASGSPNRVKIELNETNAKGFDDDALELLKAFAVNRGPDIYILAHEWIGAMVEAGYAYKLDDHIAKNPDLYGDIIPVLWESVSYKGGRYGVPQDSEVRMIFLNNDKLRAMGKDEAFIAGLSAKVENGAFTAADLCDLAAEGVKKGVVKYGFLHRPNVGPDFQMLMASFGFDPFDEASGKLQASRVALTKFFGWLKACVDKGAIPANNTAMSWDAIGAAFNTGEALAFFHGVWRVPEQLQAFKVSDQKSYFEKLTWLHSPAGEVGGKPANLSHPIIYAVSAKSKRPELAAYIVALASQPIPNTRHAVSTAHTPINNSQAAMPDMIEKGWSLRVGAPMLKYAGFMPNHAKIGQFNALIFKGIQGVETGRLTPEAAAEFVIEELKNELGDDVTPLN